MVLSQSGFCLLYVLLFITDALSELVAGVSKHTWQSLIGASLASYREWRHAKNSGLEEMGKVLHLAKTCKSSSQVLCAVADYLDFVHGYVDLWVNV